MTQAMRRNECAGGVKLNGDKPCPECGAGPRENCPKEHRWLVDQHAAMLKALKRADQFISNGIELGFIRMPDAGVPDPAHETPGIIRAAIAAAEGKP